MMNQAKIITGPFRATKLWNDAVQAFCNEMPTSKHWRGLKQYENCFTGRQAVDWMMEYLKNNPNFGPNITRAQATKLMSKFLETEVISAKRTASTREKFDDSRDLYSLSSQSPLQSLRSPQRPPLVPVLSNSNTIPRRSKSFKKSNTVRLKDEIPREEPLDISDKKLISGALLWRDVVFDRLEEVYSRLIVICDGDTSIVPKNYINGDWVWRNMVDGGLEPKSDGGLGAKELPSWILTAVKSLETWPTSTDSLCNLPNYPGVEIDVFKIVRDYFTSMVVPIIPYELYEPIVKLFIGAEFLDIANRAPTPSPERPEFNNLPRRISTGSVENLMLDLSINVSATLDTDSPFGLSEHTGPSIYESIQRPTLRTPVSPRTPRLPVGSGGYAHYKESFLYPGRDLSDKESEGRTTLRSIKNKVKNSKRKSSPIADDYIGSTELEYFPLPPNSCFETAFTSNSPITRVIPQKSVDNMHQDLQRAKSATLKSAKNLRSSCRHVATSLMPNAHGSRSMAMNKSLSEGDLLAPDADIHTRQNCENEFKRQTANKTLASRVRDSLRRKRETKRSDRRSRRFMSVVGGSGNNSTESLLSAPSLLGQKYATLDSPSRRYGRPGSTTGRLCSGDAAFDSGLVNHGLCSSTDDDAYSIDSKMSCSQSSWKRGKYSPSFSFNSSDTLIYSVRSGSSSKVSTPIGCLSHSLASPHSFYHSARSNLDATRTSFPGSKSTDLLEKDSLDSTSKALNGTKMNDVSITPSLPRREPVIIHSPAANIALNQLINDYENVAPIPTKHRSMSASHLSDIWTDRTPYGVAGTYTKEGVLEHYRSTPSKKFLGQTSKDISLGAKACFSGLLTKPGKEFCTEALQLILLLLEPPRREKLRSLLKMTRRLAKNDKIQLHPEMNNRTLMVKTFCRTVFVSERENGYDESLAVRITAFLMDSQDILFSPPSELLLQVHERQKLYNVENITTFCRQVSPSTYNAQKLSGSQQFLAELLEQIIDNPKLSAKERDKKLKEFRQHYPLIYKHKFPEEVPVSKKSLKFRKLPSLNMLSKTKSFGI